MEESNRRPTSTVEMWKDACPALETFVWIPCQRHHKLAATTSRDGRYRKQLLALTHTLMDEWSTLKVFICPGFQSLPLHEYQGTEIHVDYMEYQRAHDGNLEEQTCRKGDTLSTGLFESTETIFKVSSYNPYSVESSSDHFSLYPPNIYRKISLCIYRDHQLSESDDCDLSRLGGSSRFDESWDRRGMY